MKNTYSYPHKSREAMTAYLAEHESYGGWNHPYRKWSPLSWNVKLPMVSDDGKRGDYKTTPELDEKWEAHCRNNFELDSLILEDMRRQYLDGEYSTYPGDDQGNWEFCFAGRSGGNMLLETWQIPRKGEVNSYSLKVDFLKQFSDADGWAQWLSEIEFSTLQALYRAIRCMDSDFEKSNIGKEYEYQLNFQRQQWEEEVKEELLAEAAVAGLEPCPQI